MDDQTNDEMRIVQFNTNVVDRILMDTNNNFMVSRETVIHGNLCVSGTLEVRGNIQNKAMADQFLWTNLSLITVIVWLAILTNKLKRLTKEK